MSIPHRPARLHAVNAFVVVPDLSRLTEFLKATFGGGDLDRVIKMPNGTIVHAEMRIDDTVIFLAEPHGGPPAPANLYLYVTDVDATVAAATKAGGTTVMPPTDMFWGERVAMLSDPTGGTWFVATQREEVSAAEAERRAAALAAG